MYFIIIYDIPLLSYFRYIKVFTYIQVFNTKLTRFDTNPMIKLELGFDTNLTIKLLLGICFDF